MRVYVAAFGTAWCGLVTFGLVEALLHQPSVAIIPAAMLAFGLTLTYRMFRISAISHGDTLTIRNYFATKRLMRSDVEDFRIGRPSNQPIGKTIHLLLRDKGILAIDAAARPYVTRRGKLQLARRQAELEAWLANA
jgi:branched-subunit amino acid ABC-type transport system permease component